MHIYPIMIVLNDAGSYTLINRSLVNIDKWFMHYWWFIYMPSSKR